MTQRLYFGDILYRRKGLVWHWGIYTQFGVFHNTPEKGEHFGSLGEFAGGKLVHVIQPNDVNRDEILRRAEEIIWRPRKYNYLWRNCEHTIWEVMTGNPTSHTVTVLSTTLLVASLGYLVLRARGS